MKTLITTQAQVDFLPPNSFMLLNNGQLCTYLGENKLDTHKEVITLTEEFLITNDLYYYQGQDKINGALQ